jgi:hypothetical protein
MVVPVLIQRISRGVSPRLVFQQHWGINLPPAVFGAPNPFLPDDEDKKVSVAGI